MIRALEIYDSFTPKKLLEVRFVTVLDDHTYYDWKDHQIGTTYTGKTCRSSYGSLRELVGGLDRVEETQLQFSL